MNKVLPVAAAVLSALALVGSHQHERGANFAGRSEQRANRR